MNIDPRNESMNIEQYLIDFLLSIVYFIVRDMSRKVSFLFESFQFSSNQQQMINLLDFIFIFQSFLNNRDISVAFLGSGVPKSTSTWNDCSLDCREGHMKKTKKFVCGFVTGQRSKVIKK